MTALAIAWRELRSLFLSPLSWVVLVVVQGILGYQFILQLWHYERSLPVLASIAAGAGMTTMVVAPIYKSATVLVMLVAPLLTMRLFSEERRAGTVALLLSSPVGVGEIVLGKFVAIAAYMLVIACLVSTLALSLLGGSSLDLGLLASCALGLVLASWTYAAIGLVLSLVSESPGACAAVTAGVLLVLWQLDGFRGEAAASAITGWLALTPHVDPFLRGIVDTANLGYHAILITACLALAMQRLDALRRVA